MTKPEEYSVLKRHLKTLPRDVSEKVLAIFERVSKRMEIAEENARALPKQIADAQEEIEVLERRIGHYQKTLIDLKAQLANLLDQRDRKRADN